MSRGIRESQEERVLHAIFIVTLEDIRWLFRVQRELPQLLIEPRDIFKTVHREFLALINEGKPLSPDSRAILTTWMDIDRHWLSLFRERIGEKGFPLMRQIQRRVSSRYFGNELFYLWEPEELLDKAEQLAPLNWKIAPEYTIPYEHKTFLVPMAGGEPVKTPECEWKQEEKDVLYFFGSSDMETFERMRRIPQIKISYTEQFKTIQDNLDEMAKQGSTTFLYNLAKVKMLEACLRNDYIWWQILERELEKIFLFTVTLRVFGRRVYNFNDLRKVVDKLYNCHVVPQEKKEEFHMRAKTIADQLLYPFEKAEAEEHGYSDVKEYYRQKEQQFRKEHQFLGVFVSPGDQDLICDWVISYHNEQEMYPENKQAVSDVDYVLVNYGYDFADKPYHRGYRLKQNGKWVYTSNMIYDCEKIYEIPYEERDFSTNCYELDAKIVMEVLKKHDFVFTKEGWKLPYEKKAERLIVDRSQEIFSTNIKRLRIVDPVKPDTIDIKIEIIPWDASLAKQKLANIETNEPYLLKLNSHNLIFTFLGET